MKSVIAGALGLVILQVIVANPGSSGRISGFAGTVSSAVATFVDPTKPMFTRPTTT